MPRDTLPSINPDDIGRPKGRYIVELSDRHTGKRQELISVDNYISPVAERVAKWNHGRMFHHGNPYVSEGLASNEWTVNDVSLSGPPRVPVEWIAGTSSDLAENTASDWGTGYVVGCGSRWRANVAASGARGQINESQCLVTPDVTRLVWDFNEDQGNGTIESLLIGRLAGNASDQQLQCGLAGEPYRLDVYNDLGSVIHYDRAFGHENGEVLVWSRDKFYTYTLADWTDRNDNLDAGTRPSLVEAATITGAPTTTNNTQSGVSYFNYDTQAGICKIGGDFVLAYSDGKGYMNVGRWPAAGGGPTYRTATLPHSGVTEQNNSDVDICYDGTWLYAITSCTTDGSNLSVYRINPATGAVDGVIPLPATPGGGAMTIMQYATGITTDGTDLYVSTNVGVVKMTTAGAVIDYLGRIASSNRTEASLAPFGPSYFNMQLMGASQDRDPVYYMVDQGAVSTGISFIKGGRTADLMGSVGNLGWHSGVIYAGSYIDGIGFGQGIALVMPLVGQNIWSRSVLDTPIAKSSSSTMKWTYELTVPSEWREHPFGQAPPI